MKTVLLLIDALKSGYLTNQNMPFLSELAEENVYVKKIMPGAGFCERSEIFSGLSPTSSGNFGAIGFDSARSEYKNTGFFASLSALVGKISPRVMRVMWRIYCAKSGKTLRPYRIPPKSMKNFVLTEDGPHCYGVSDETILTQLNAEGKQFALEAFTSLAARNKPVSTDNIVNFINNSDADFLPVYYGEIDAMGHAFGGDIDKMKPHLAKADALVRLIYEGCIENQNAALLVLGDHGMVRVTKSIDIIARVSQLNMKLGRDYEAFYDSTVARFWCDDAEKRGKIRTMLDGLPSENGFVLTQSRAKELGIPILSRGANGENLYGDIIWCAEEGTLISPDYFHAADGKIHGMHGYVNRVSADGCGLMVVVGTGKKTVDTGRLIDVCPTLCALIGIVPPSLCEGVSLL